MYASTHIIFIEAAANTLDCAVLHEFTRGQRLREESGEPETTFYRIMPT